ncbi:hypothetical protein U6A24_11210 [Aquimarina gracilis]|uniref:Prepilin type IV endopeptidase peptidase domain-containing protein n=1 Tax=Aquimarina gracilis TaxID=874422 RepID=A0ABU5ZVY5_9FLAO|nr:hypothetical protein [Aquimarina gracilis]MEB3346034.1 hypothetical protein [Aquimarina gracilis]
MLYQDIKYRHIHIALPILVFVVAIYINIERFELYEVLKSIGFIAINFAAITAYFSFKTSKLQNPFKDYIGIGDLVFLIAVTPMFSFRNFMLFFISGMIVSLLLYVLFQKQSTNKTIPLAGYLSLYIILIMIPNLFLTNNLFYDFII